MTETSQAITLTCGLITTIALITIAWGLWRDYLKSKKELRELNSNIGMIGKPCPKCNERLVNLTSLNKRMCSNYKCDINYIDWDLKDGQSSPYK